MIMNHINIALLGAVSKYFAVSYTSFIQSISFPSPEESTMVAVEGDLTDLGSHPRLGHGGDQLALQVAFLLLQNEHLSLVTGQI